MTQQFLSALGDTHIFCAFHPGGKLLPKENTPYNTLVELNALGYGIYYCVNEMAGGRGKGNCILARAIWIDDDQEVDEPRTDFPIPPSFTVNTSPGKYQYLWLTETEDLEEWDAVQQRMVNSWGSDKNARDRARVLRLPGFNHTKKEPYPVTYTGDGKKYDWATIKESFPPVTKDDPTYKPDSESQPWIDRLNGIKTGENYHENIIALMTGMIKDGLDKSMTRDIMRFVLENADSKDERWQKRYDALDENLSSVVKKFRDDRLSVQDAINQLTTIENQYVDFPQDIIPTRLKKAAIEISRAVGTPFELPMIALLSYYMNALGHTTKIYEKPYHKLLPSLGFILMLSSGERKSGTLNMMNFIIDECKKISFKRYQRDKATYKARKELFEKDMKALKKELDNTGPTDVKARNAVLKKIEELAEQEPMEPAMPRIAIDDATEEAIRDAIIDNGGTLLVHSADGRAIMNTIMGRYKNAGGTGESIFIKGIANDPIDNHRVGKKDEVLRSIDASCLNLMCMVQPDLVYKMLSGNDFAVSGLIARLLFIEPKPKVGKRIEHEDDKPYDNQYLEAMGDIIINAYHCTDFSLRLDDEASKIRRQYNNKIEEDMDDGGKYEEDSDFVNKIVSNAVRIAATFYCIDHPEKIRKGGVEYITDKYMVDGIKAMEHFMERNLQLVKYKRIQQSTSVAVDMLRLAHQKHYKRPFSFSVLKVYLTMSKRDLAEDALQILFDVGCIEFESKRGGKIVCQLTDLGIKVAEQWDQVKGKM